MPKNDKQYFHIFTAGKYEFAAEDGSSIFVEFSNEEVQQIAANYNKNIFESNLHIGHDHSEPEQPALAWIDDCKAEAGKLFCSFSHISKRAIEISEEKEYKKCSVELGRVDGMPGKYLVGLGFTNYPRVTDLPPFEFSAYSKFAKFKQPETFLIDAINFSNPNNLTKSNMKISENVLNFAQRIGLNVTEFNSDKDVLDAAAEAIAKLQANFANDAETVGSLSLYVDKYSKMPETITGLNTRIAALEASETENIINNAILAGKILPGQKEMFSNMAKSVKIEQLKDDISKLPVQALFKKDVVPTGGNSIPEPDAGVLNDPKFKNADGSALTFQQFSKRTAGKTKADKDFVQQFTMEDVQKLPGYKEAPEINS